MSVIVRQARLIVQCKLRVVGWLPWLGLVAWSCFAAAAEPAVLRGSGVRLREAATWVAAVVVWIVLASSARGAAPSRFVARWGADWALLWLVGGVGSLLGTLLGFLVPMAGQALAPVTGWLWFVFSLTPLVFALSASTQVVISNILMAILLVPAAGAMSALWLAPERVAALTASTGLACGAGVLATLALSGPGVLAAQHRNRA